MRKKKGIYAMDGMDILGYLKSRQNELERIHHPFVERSEGFRYLYSFGIGVLALGNMKSITELQDDFDYFLECISLEKEQREKILPDLNNYFEFRLTECFKILRTKEIQYCFLIDLYKLQNKAVWSLDYCRKITKNYGQIFHLSENEIAFFENFNANMIKSDVEACKRVYNEFKNQGFDISYELLQYFYPDYSDNINMESVEVKMGKTVIIDKPAVINGNITVDRGASLIIKNADIVINGSIHVDGGRIQILKSRIMVKDCKVPFFLVARDAAVVRIEDSSVDCNMKCGFLIQNSGRLFVLESQISNCDKKCMVSFSGLDGKIVKSSFFTGNAGILYIADAANMEIIECDFNGGISEYGGAVYSETVNDVLIQKCAFRNCRAKFLGSAIYFKYQKLGQVVNECYFNNNEPADSVVFNTFEDDFLLKIR